MRCDSPCGQVHMSMPASPGHRIPAARLVGGAEGADVGGEVVLPERRPGPGASGRRQDTTEPDLPGPALAEDLVDLAAVVRSDGLLAGGVGVWMKYSPLNVCLIEVLRRRARRWRGTGRRKPRRPSLGPSPRRRAGAARYSELSQATSPNHSASSVFCCGPSRTPSPFPSWPISHSIALLDPRPVALEEGIVGRHLVLAVGAQQGAGLAVDRQPLRTRREGRSCPSAWKPTPSRSRTRSRSRMLQLGEQPGHGMGVMPDVRAGARAAADALPAIEAASGKAVTGRGGQDRGVEKRAVEEPVRQRRIVPGVAPQARLAVQPLVSFATYRATAAAESNRAA